jgi:cytidylate kinase
VAPYAGLSLAQTGKIFYGMAIARQIEIHQYASMTNIPFTFGF